MKKKVSWTEAQKKEWREILDQLCRELKVTRGELAAKILKPELN